MKHGDRWPSDRYLFSRLEDKEMNILNTDMPLSHHTLHWWRLGIFFELHLGNLSFWMYVITSITIKKSFKSRTGLFLKFQSKNWILKKIENWRRRKSLNIWLLLILFCHEYVCYQTEINPSTYFFTLFIFSPKCSGFCCYFLDIKW